MYTAAQSLVRCFIVLIKTFVASSEKKNVKPNFPAVPIYFLCRQKLAKLGVNHKHWQAKRVRK